jgi:predicted permease
MSARELWLRCTYPLWRWRAARDLRDEIELHLALRAEQLERNGISAEEAARAARRRFGNESRIIEASRATWGWQWLDGLGRDVRYVARQLRRAPGFALITCLTIAGAIAVNATAFTFYDAVVLKPLPVPQPSRMIRVVQDKVALGSELLPFAVYDVLHRGTRSLSGVVATTGPQSMAAVLPGRALDDAQVISARFVSPDFFHALGIRPSHGRWFDDTDDRAVVLDYRFWSRTLGADPSVLGRRLRINDVEFTILGIAAEDFAGTGMPAVAPDLWIPQSVLPAVLPNTDWRHDKHPHWQVLGRLTSGTSMSQLTAELTHLRASVTDSAGKPVPLIAKRATFFQTDGGEFEVFQQVSAAFMVALALILAIAALNLVNLFAARNVAREREISVRLTLGASRHCIARQLASESTLLAIMGGALGLLLARSFAAALRDWIVATMASVSGGTVGVFLDVHVDWRVTLYTILVSLAIGIAVGLWPALRATRGDASVVLRQGGTSTSGAATWSSRNILLALQVAGSIVLLTTAGVLLGGLRLARDIAPGFDADHLLVVNVDDPAPYAERVVRRAELGRRLAALPAVRVAAWSQRVPFGGTHLRRANTSAGPITISIDLVSETYFDALGMPTLRGRAFTRQEVESNAPVMLVSESAARLRWPGGGAIGKSVPPNDVLSGPDTTQAYTVIGIVPDIRSNFLSRLNGPSTYYPYRYDGPFGSFLLRTRGAPAGATAAVRRAVAEVSPLLGSRTLVLTMREGPMALQRLMTDAPATIALGLALAGLFLASIGVYGLISQIVTRRTREIGVHMAIGARPLQVLALVIRETLRPVALGAIGGGVLAAALSTLLQKLIVMPDVPDLTFGTGAFNPEVYLGVLLALTLVVIAACWIPARRAALVDPTVALRAE